MKNVAIIYGGMSDEHEISILSAFSVYAALADHPYALSFIYLSRSGALYEQGEPQRGQMRSEEHSDTLLSITPSKGIFRKDGTKLFVDIAIPIVHGKGGEDGALQGFLSFCLIPFISSGILGSSIGMHKSVAKRLAMAEGVPVLPSILLKKKDLDLFRNFQITTENLAGVVGSQMEPSSLYETLTEVIRTRLGGNIICKPDDEGSSIGLFSITDLDELQLEKALNGVFQVSDRALIEPFMTDRIEVECGVIEDGAWLVSEPVIIDKGGIPLTYHTKYEVAESLESHGVSIDEKIKERVQAYALTLAEVLQIEGFSRIDFFVGKTSGEIYFNEINTLPGMTARSAFPAMTDSLGYPLGNLLALLIERKLWKG